MNKKHVGSSFDDFLAEKAMLENATTVAAKRVLDESDTSLTLTTLASAATALGKTIRIEWRVNRRKHS